MSAHISGGIGGVSQADATAQAGSVPTADPAAQADSATADSAPQADRASASSATPILDAACVAFADNGYAGTTLDEIARVAGMTVDAVTAVYPDTAALLLAVLTRRDDSDGGQVQLLHQPSGIELLHGLKVLVRASRDAVAAARLHTRMTGAATAVDHPAHRWAVERYQWTRSLFTAALRRDQDAGLLRDDVDPRAVAIRLIAVMDGLQLQWLLDPTEVDVAEHVDAYIETLIADIRATGE